MTDIDTIEEFVEQWASNEEKIAWAKVKENYIYRRKDNAATERKTNRTGSIYIGDETSTDPWGSVFAAEH